MWLPWWGATYMCSRNQRGPCVLKHKYHHHWNHRSSRVGFWGVPSIEPFWGGSSQRALSTSPEVKARLHLGPMNSGGHGHPLDRVLAIVSGDGDPGPRGDGGAFTCRGAKEGGWGGANILSSSWTTKNNVMRLGIKCIGNGSRNYSF